MKIHRETKGGITEGEVESFINSKIQSAGLDALGAKHLVEIEE